MWPKILLGAILLFLIILLVNFYLRYSNELNQKLNNKKMFLRVEASSKPFKFRLDASYYLLTVITLLIVAMMITPSLVFLRPVTDPDEYKELMDERNRLIINPSHAKASAINQTFEVTTERDKTLLIHGDKTYILTTNFLAMFDLNENQAAFHEYENVEVQYQTVLILEDQLIVYRNVTKSRKPQSSIYIHDLETLQVKTRVETNGQISHLTMMDNYLCYDAMNNFYTPMSLRTVQIRQNGVLQKAITQNYKDVFYISEVGLKRQVSFIKIELDTLEVEFHSFLVSDSFSVGYGDNIIYAFNNIGYRTKESTTTLMGFSWKDFRIEKMVVLEGLAYRPLAIQENGNFIVQTIVRGEDKNTHHIYEMYPSVSLNKRSSMTLSNDESLLTHQGKYFVLSEKYMFFHRTDRTLWMDYAENTLYRSALNEYVVELSTEEKIHLKVYNFNHLVQVIDQEVDIGWEEIKQYDVWIDEDVLWLFVLSDDSIYSVAIELSTGEVLEEFTYDVPPLTKVLFSQGWIVLIQGQNSTLLDKELTDIYE